MSSNLAEIPIAAAEVVRLAFRLGVLVDEVSQDLQPRELVAQNLPDSWATALPDATLSEVQEELDAVHAREVSQQ